MNNSLGKNYSLISLLIFALPNMIMMVFLSLYTIVDGAFVSRYVGTTALSAVNMVYPAISIEMAIGIMIATGGNAIIAKRMGEDKNEQARENFSYLVMIEFLIGIFIAILGNLFLSNIVKAFGATEQQLELCKLYLSILFIFAPCFLLQTAFQIFFVTAGKPTIGLIVTVASGVANIVLDYLFIVCFNMGIAGAAGATGIGYSVSAVVGLVYFAFFRKKHLYFVKPKTEEKLLISACANGSSEMVTNLANAITTFLFNYIFLKFYGEDGVASITIVLYLEFVFTAIFFGYSNGIAPIVSFKYGQRNINQLKRIFKSSLFIVVICGLLGFVCSHIFIDNILLIFTPYKNNVYDISLYGFRRYSFALLFMGINIFASAWFTALSNGKVSAIISFTRTFLFLVGTILILPVVVGAVGGWIAVPCAEVLGIAVSIYYLKKLKIYYNY